MLKPLLSAVLVVLVVVGLLDTAFWNAWLAWNILYGLFEPNADMRLIAAPATFISGFLINEPSCDTAPP